MAVTMLWYAIVFHSLATIFRLNSCLGIAFGMSTIWIIVGAVIGKIILDIVTCSQLQNLSNEEQQSHMQQTCQIINKLIGYLIVHFVFLYFFVKTQ